MSTSAIVHRTEPPCSCTACLRATFAADQRRAALDEIFRRLDDLAQSVASEADE